MPLIPSPWTVGTTGGAVLATLSIAAGAYFLGCFNGSVIVSKYILHDDVRNHGSGNAGLTNFYRTFGGSLTAAVLLCDVLKAVIAVWWGVQAFHFVSWSGLEEFGKYFAALFCLLGHMFPCMFHFKGGKGILSGGAIVLMIDWRIALIAFGGFLILTILTRYVSLGSIWAALSFPFTTMWLYHDAAIIALAFLCSALVIWQHRGNIQRLLHGTENKFHLHHNNQEGGHK